jgi:gamma-glutamylputrescine oxidase
LRLADTDAALARDGLYTLQAPPGPAAPPLQGSQRCDVAVVGGGLAGLSAALELAQRGRDVVLLEAGDIGGGASGRNGGQVIAGLACDIETIEAQLGLDEARRVYAMTLEAVDLVRQRIEAHGIAAEWQPGFLAVATTAGKAAALERQVARIEHLYGHAQQAITRDALPAWIASPRYAGAAFDALGGHLQPLKYTRGLAHAAVAAGVRLHAASPVRRLVPGAQPVLHTDQGQLQAGQVLLAGNVTLHGVHGLADVARQIGPRVMPVGTYIAATDPLPEGQLHQLIPCKAAVCDTNFVLDYFRPSADGRLLYGGRVSYSTHTPGDLRRSLQRRMAATFPVLKDTRIAHCWGGFVDITMNRAPDFGRLPPASPGQPANVYYLQGFSGHGLALTGLAGRLVAEAMTGDASRFDVFARLRHRPFPGGPALRTPALVLGMTWYRLRDLLG